MNRVPVITLGLCAFALLAHFSPPLAESLQFDRTALDHGEFWRLLTGHFTHFDANHLRWDLVVFFILGIFTEWRSRFAFVACLLAAAFAVSVGIWVAQPQFTIYRGLSGVDSALFGFIALGFLRFARRLRDTPLLLVGTMVLAAFLAKSGWELVFSETLFVDSQNTFAPSPFAHLLGAFVGCWVFALRPLRRFTRILVESSSRFREGKRGVTAATAES